MYDAASTLSNVFEEDITRKERKAIVKVGGKRAVQRRKKNASNFSPLSKWVMAESLERIIFDRLNLSAKVNKVLLTLPSEKQKRIGCDGCSYLHIKTNQKCSANKKRKPLKPNTCRNLKTGEVVSGLWKLEDLEFRARTKLGRGSLMKLQKK